MFDTIQCLLVSHDNISCPSLYRCVDLITVLTMYEIKKRTAPNTNVKDDAISVFKLIIELHFGLK